MNMRTLPRLLEPEDLLKMPDSKRYELIDGRPVEREMGAEADDIGCELIILLRTFCRANGLGRVYGAGTGYQCFPSNPKRVRIPDVSFVATGRLPGNRTPEGYITVAPDFAAEVVSPRDRYEAVQLKMMDYKDAKVRLIWVISPKTKTVLIRRLDGTCAELDANGELSGEDVIPGFACKVAELFV